MVKDGSALARATSIGPRAATALEVSADAAGGIPRCGFTRRGGNNDLLWTFMARGDFPRRRCKVILVGWWIVIFYTNRSYHEN